MTPMEAEVNQIMRNLHFSDDESGEYVSRLRTLLRWRIEGNTQFEIPWVSIENINNEERALRILRELQ